MRINPKILQIAFRMLLPCTAGLILTTLPVHAESYLSGTYRCTSVEVAGKTVPCKAPSLVLKSDGSYNMLSETGTYEIGAGRWLVLSASKSHGRPRLPWSKLGHLARVLNLIWYITLQSDVFRSSPSNGLVIASSECACNVKGSGQHEGG